MKVCAMIDRSAGNESVGDMWTETAVFEDTATLKDVIKWAGMIYDSIPRDEIPNYRKNVKLAILQDLTK